MGPGSPRLRALALVLTARCNLSCSYCFQNAKTSRRMEWPTLQASLDLALGSPEPELRLVFLGGEPLLEIDSMRRTVEYVEAHRRPGQHIRYVVITNGVKLDEPILDLLIRHDFETQLSFDGVPEAQALRGSRTFALLDALLDRLRQQHADFYRRCVNINMTLTPATVPQLARSVAYFLEKEMAELSISPIFTDSSSWQRERIAELDAQFRSIYRASLEHYRRTGQVPLTLFRVHAAESGLPRPARISMCGAGAGRNLTADVDGTLHGCLTFAGSFQRPESRFLADRLQSMRIGSVDDPDLVPRVERYRRAAQDARIFDDKQNKHSSYGKCGECRYLATCGVCPISIGHLKGNEDPDRVPDFQCAFNLVANKYRDLFPVARSPAGLAGRERAHSRDFARIRAFTDQLAATVQH